MKNVASIKSSKIDSPKTPGGISKSLLTPCRRVGLSRNWRKGGVSPFVSPVSGSGEPKQEVQTKRKIDDVDLNKPKNIGSGNEINTTPSRSVDVPKRKKSKILSADPELTPPATKSCKPEESTSVQNTPFDLTPNEVVPEVLTPIIRSKSTNSLENDPSEGKSYVCDENVTPVLKSKSHKKFTPPLTSNIINDNLPKQEVDPEVKVTPVNVAKLKSRNNTKKLDKSKKKSPENLTKECMVVIRKKIFKKTTQELENDASNEIEPKKTSQVLFDSDSDDLPLCQFNKKENEVSSKNLTEKNSPVKDKVQNSQIQPRVLALDEDDDFMESNKKKVQKLEDKTTSTSSLKKMAKKKPKENKPVIKETQTSQSSDDDDFDFNTKRTILIRKSYDKVSKPSKAKSTGSITQRDIDELRSRIDVKKKLLLAKAMSNDTEKLRTLIKKWQKGCQDALSELMEMMRNKFPDKQNMEFSEMLQTLKIPTSLVGYDEENDCFNTPDDASIVLAKFNDL